MTKALNMDNYNPKKEDILILDTNILIDLFYPMNLGKDISSINKLYQKVVKAGTKIIVSSVQVSEFINRCIRFQFDLYKGEHPECQNFKTDYRSESDYMDCMSTILDIVKNEWKNTIEFIDDKFSELPADKIFINNFAYDFNDALIVEIANKYNAIFVTNDNDFISYKLNKPMLSTNRLLLAAR